MQICMLLHSAKTMLQHVTSKNACTQKRVTIVLRPTLSGSSSTFLQWAVCCGQKMPAQKHRCGVCCQVHQEETQQIEPPRGVEGGH